MKATIALVLALTACGGGSDLAADRYLPGWDRVLGVGGALAPGGAFHVHSSDESVARVQDLGAQMVVGVAPGTTDVDVLDDTGALLDTIPIEVAALTELRLDGMPDHFVAGETRDLQIVPLVGHERAGGYYYLRVTLDGATSFGVVYDTLRLGGMSAGAHRLELTGVYGGGTFTFALDVR